MGRIDSRDIACLMEVVSYKYISAQEAKEAAEKVLEEDKMASEEKRMFLESFCRSFDS